MSLEVLLGKIFATAIVLLAISIPVPSIVGEKEEVDLVMTIWCWWFCITLLVSVVSFIAKVWVA